MSGCFDAHTSGVECPRCRRARQRRWRQRAPDAERGRRRERTEEEQLADKARAYVWTYLRRGKLSPPGECQICGAGGPVVFWHPDVCQPCEIVWLCRRDRDRVASTLEPIKMTWLWPGRTATDAEVRIVQPNRTPRGALRAERRRQAKELQAVEATAALRAQPPHRDPAKLLEQLEAAERNVDEVLARVTARMAAFDLSRRA